MSGKHWKAVALGNIPLKSEGNASSFRTVVGLEEGNSMTKETQEVLRKFITQQEAADYCNVTVRTIRNWIADGFIKGYRMPGGHLVRIDLDELTAAISTVPTVKR